MVVNQLKAHPFQSFGFRYVNLGHPYTGVSLREGKLVYMFSQLCVVDEIKHRERLVSMTFFDFMEAVARMADLVSPVDDAALDDFFGRVEEWGPEVRRCKLDPNLKAPGFKGST